MWKRANMDLLENILDHLAAEEPDILKVGETKIGLKEVNIRLQLIVRCSQGLLQTKDILLCVRKTTGNIVYHSILY